MRSINKVIIIGNLTRDPEMRQTPNGQNVTTFGIATNREWMTKEGDRKKSAEFHECVAWANLADICQKFLKKGNLVYIEGYLKTRSWDSQEGIKKFKTEIVVKDMIRLEKRAGTDEGEDYVPEYETDEEVHEEAAPAAAVEVAAALESPVEEPVSPPVKDEENPIDKDLGL
ncbi:single-stranded DNA-binding protein [Candidatus Peregrinibacteria bacterium]|nr:single-stranded DNA-binding protein [Candidatus Peregrinibacteria bacterium]